MTTALEQQREDQALGAAWRRCEAALPEYWELQLESYRESYTAKGIELEFPEVYKDGPTPTAALEALAEALETRGAAE